MYLAKAEMRISIFKKLAFLGVIGVLYLEGFSSSLKWPSLANHAFFQEQNTITIGFCDYRAEFDIV